MIGGVVVAWTLSAPISEKLVTTQYVIQLVPYVKGQVKAVHAQANQPMKRGDLLLEIEPAPYQYAVDQAAAQLKSSKANVDQANDGFYHRSRGGAKSLPSGEQFGGGAR